MQTFVPALAMLATVLASATPALARTAKPATVKLPASALADPAARLCMPKSVMPGATRDQPNTVCQTQAEWAAAGVTIVPR